MRILDTMPPTLRSRIGVVAMCSLLFSGCGGYGSGGTYTSTPVLTGVSITPSSEMMTTGTTATLMAVGTYSNSTTADITGLVAWTSTASAVANISASGVVAAGSSAGTANISASISNPGMYGGVLAATSTITVTAATLTGITIVPATVTVNRGATTAFTATGTFSDSSSGNVSGGVSWLSSDPTVATVNAGGVATGVGSGSCLISASVTTSSGTVSNSASLTVP